MRTNRPAAALEHLESFDADQSVNEAQAIELTKKGGPLRTKMRAILVGDLNTDDRNLDKAKMERVSGIIGRPLNGDHGNSR